jgi:hypothetical protein
MASIINASTSGVGGVITTADNSGVLNIQTAGTTAISVDTSRNVIVNGTTAYNNAANRGNVTIEGATTSILNLGIGGTLGGYVYHNGTDIDFRNSKTGAIQFATTGIERMRLDASGNLLVGATGNAGTGAIVYANGTFAGTGYNTRTGTGGSFTGNSFNINWTGSVAELYIATTKVVANLSDYRFKKNIVSQTDNAISKVMNLRPVVYELADNGIYKADGIVREGFIAHELAEIIPSAVEGAKDQVDEEGKDIPQGLKLDAIVSVLTKSIQEQQVMIQELKAEIDLLKGVK